MVQSPHLFQLNCDDSHDDDDRDFDDDDNDDGDNDDNDDSDTVDDHHLCLHTLISMKNPMTKAQIQRKPARKYKMFLFIGSGVRWAKK